MKQFPLVSVVFVTYKRVDKLKETYTAFLQHCTYPNLELIVSDDGSPTKDQMEIKKLKFDKYCLSKKNQGMGYNQNQGIKAASGEYIFHLQDDWVLKKTSDFLEQAVSILESNEAVGLIRLWGNVEGLKNLIITKTVYDNKKCYVLLGKKSLKSNEASFYSYSDRPHLKRKDLHNIIGLYNIDIKPVLQVELDFCKRFENSGYTAILMADYQNLFDHTGIDETFNIDQKKENIRRKINNSVIFGKLWRLYVYLRYGKEASLKW